MTVQERAMAHGRNKYQSRESRMKVREILVQEWNPIGVRDAPDAQDEYDDYVGRVYVMLMDERASLDEVAEYLYRIATEHMGLSPRPELAEHSKQAAGTLVSLRPVFELH
jgi:hypothetical protein